MSLIYNIRWPVNRFSVSYSMRFFTHLPGCLVAGSLALGWHGAAAPLVTEVLPGNGTVVRRDALVRFTIKDIDTAVDGGSLRLLVNGVPVICQASVTKDLDLTIIEHRALFDVDSTNTATLIFSDTGSPPLTQTNSSVFSVHAFPTAGSFVIEAEDFDYDSGHHLAVANTMPYYGGAYSNRAAIAGIDYFRSSSGFPLEYRPANVPIFTNVAQGSLAFDRGDWTNTLSYLVGESDSPQWFNYTRTIPSNSYEIWAAMSHGQIGPDLIRARLDLVTGGFGTTNQSLQALGNFTAPGTGVWGLLTAVPMRDATGNRARVNLSGTQTFRFTIDDGDLDFFVFAPAGPARAPLQGGIRLSCGEAVITWTGTETLETTESLSAPDWQPISASGIYSTPLTGASRFFRIRD